VAPGPGGSTRTRIERGPRIPGCTVESRVRAEVRLRSWLTQAYIQLYSACVRFSWDAAKNARNLKERGFDFEFATLIFEGPTLEREDARRDYGERRVVAIGVAQGIALTVVYTDRTEAGDVLRRIISARVSDRDERKAYFEATSRR